MTLKARLIWHKRCLLITMDTVTGRDLNQWNVSRMSNDWSIWDVTKVYSSVQHKVCQEIGWWIIPRIFKYSIYHWRLAKIISSSHLLGPLGESVRQFWSDRSPSALELCPDGKWIELNNRRNLVSALCAAKKKNWLQTKLASFRTDRGFQPGR